MRRERTPEEIAKAAAEYVLCVQECKHWERVRAEQVCEYDLVHLPCWINIREEISTPESACHGCMERRVISSGPLMESRRRRANAWRRLVRAVGE